MSPYLDLLAALRSLLHRRELDAALDAECDRTIRLAARGIRWHSRRWHRKHALRLQSRKAQMNHAVPPVDAKSPPDPISTPGAPLSSLDALRWLEAQQRAGVPVEVRFRPMRGRSADGVTCKFPPDVQLLRGDLDEGKALVAAGPNLIAVVAHLRDVLASSAPSSPAGAPAARPGA